MLMQNIKCYQELFIKPIEIFLKKIRKIYILTRYFIIYVNNKNLKLLITETLYFIYSKIKNNYYNNIFITIYIIQNFSNKIFKIFGKYYFPLFLSLSFLHKIFLQKSFLFTKTIIFYKKYKYYYKKYNSS